MAPSSRAGRARERRTFASSGAFRRACGESGSGVRRRRPLNLDFEQLAEAKVRIARDAFEQPPLDSRSRASIRLSRRSGDAASAPTTRR